MNRSVEQILKQPYSRVLRPAEEGGYTAEVLEFPGCVTQGETLEEAYANLEDAARGWLEAVIELGQNVPDPATESEYSGKIVLRLPRSLHRVAATLAERDGVSLNTFLATAIAERVGAVARPMVVTLQMQGTADKLSSARVRKLRYDAMNRSGQSSMTLNQPPKRGRLLLAGSVGSRVGSRRSVRQSGRKR
jgi:predicted RNase H-like HicB family nuclease